MDYRYLKAFLAVARCKNFTQAGDELNVAQSAISRQIKLLEESLRQQLMVRSPQGVILTPAGEALYSHCQNFEKWSMAYFQGQEQEIRIGVMSGVVDSWLIPRLTKLKESELPNLSLKIQNERFIRQDLEKGDLDMGLLVAPIETENITSRILFKESYTLISKHKVDIKRLDQERWIFGTSGSFLKKISKKVSQRFIRANSVSSIIQMVQAGMGVAVLPSQLVRGVKGVKKQDLSIGKGSIYLALPNYKVMPQLMSQIVEHLSS